MTTTRFHIGTSGYSYKEWKGTFYPQKLPAKGMLAYYGERFGSVESNSTFRMMPKASVLKAWTTQVPDDFLFALKAPQQITHFKRLRDVAEPVEAFIKVSEVLGNRLGPLLFQLPPNFKKDLPRLEAFLKLLPPERRFALEFRNNSWFDDEVLGVLRDHKVALCLAEAEDELDTPFVSTADWGYMRLRLVDYSDADLKQWIKRIESQKWRDAFVYFKHEDQANGPRLAERMTQLLPTPSTSRKHR